MRLVGRGLGALLAVAGVVIFWVIVGALLAGGTQPVRGLGIPEDAWLLEESWVLGILARAGLVIGARSRGGGGGRAVLARRSGQRLLLCIGGRYLRVEIH